MVVDLVEVLVDDIDFLVEDLVVGLDFEEPIVVDIILEEPDFEVEYLEEDIDHNLVVEDIVQDKVVVVVVILILSTNNSLILKWKFSKK